MHQRLLFLVEPGAQNLGKKAMTPIPFAPKIRRKLRVPANSQARKRQ
jgi:hypothetical protein